MQAGYNGIVIAIDLPASGSDAIKCTGEKHKSVICLREKTETTETTDEAADTKAE